MAAKLISNVITPVKSTEKGRKVLRTMNALRISHIPVVNGKDYHGLIPDKLINDLKLQNEPIEKSIDKLDKIYVVEDQHILEVASLMYKHKLSVIPVLDAEQNYLGAISLYDLAWRFGSYFSLHEVGGVIVLEININDYLLSQISHIVESNDTKILSLFMNRIPGTNKLEVILKLDKEDLSPVIQTFIRYDYNIKGVYLDHSVLNDLFHDRYQQFMRFMNI